MPVLTGPNILLDVSGSMHVNGFINFLRNGNSTTQIQSRDNPFGQMTYNSDAVIEYKDVVINNITNRAVPDGAIWVGLQKRSLYLSFTLENKPRLYIQYQEKIQVLTEKDSDIISRLWR